MTIRAPRHERRVAFARTVVAIVHADRVTQTAAFHRVNTAHPVLSNEFPSVNSFEQWLSRNRQEVAGIGDDSIVIPAIFDDVAVSNEGARLSDFPGHVRVRDTPRPSTERQDRRERFDAAARIAKEIGEAFARDPSALDIIARRIARLIVDE